MYENFDGEGDFELNAVDLTTVHRAKGLEWPVVFVPSMTARRFPSSRTGQPRDWLVPRDRFAASRYEGSDADERRLFYVAMTRARDWVSMSRHDRVKTQQARPSPYVGELGVAEVGADDVRLPTIEPRFTEQPTIEVTYSELAAFLECGMAFRLRNLIGFKPRLAPELGCGKAVHHVLRTVADQTREIGFVPSEAEIDGILDASFFLPMANKPAHRQLKAAARRLVTSYAEDHADDLHRVWETERPFELHLDGITVSGRADVILDHEGGESTALAILDYKTSTQVDDDHGPQLQLYTDAGGRENLDVREHAFDKLRMLDCTFAEFDVAIERAQVIEEHDLHAQSLQELLLVVDWIRPLHVVVVVDEDPREERILTVYEPNPNLVVVGLP